MKVFKKFAIILFVLSIGIFGLSPLFSVKAAGKFSTGTTIADIPLEGATYEEVKHILQQKVDAWYEGDALISTSEYETIEIPRSVFQFDIPATIKKLNSETKRHWSTFFQKRKNVHLPFIVKIDRDHNDFQIPDYIDGDQLLASVAEIASYLGDASIKIPYVKEPIRNFETLGTVDFPITNLSNTVLSNMVEQLNGYVIEQKGVFSLLDHLGTMAHSEEESNFIASALYQLVLPTSLEILERHTQTSIPSYTGAGLDAAVDRADGKDLLIYNPHEFAYTMDAQINDRTLKMSIQSIATEDKYEIQTENKIEIEPRTIYRYSNDIKYNESIKIQDGKKGIQIETYRLSGQTNGSSEKTLVSRDFYPPIPNIVLVSADFSKQDQGLVDTNTNNEETAPPENNDIDLDSLFEGTSTNDMNANLKNVFLYCFADQIENINDKSNNDQPGETDDEDAEEATEDQKINPCDLFWLLLYGSGDDLSVQKSELLKEFLEKGVVTDSDDEAETEGVK